MERAGFDALLQEVWSRGHLAACTPFDEESVEIIDEMGFDLIKVASCSAKDWPLLEAVSASGKPVICSTGGLTTFDIDNVVSFFQHRAVHFALMHCVSIYPTPDEKLALQQIRNLDERYPDTVVGWSTHEDPDDTVPVGMAMALGAQHVRTACRRRDRRDHTERLLIEPRAAQPSGWPHTRAQR